MVQASHFLSWDITESFFLAESTMSVLIHHGLVFLYHGLVLIYHGRHFFRIAHFFATTAAQIAPGLKKRLFEQFF
jgi:hypothetical protein